MPSLLPPSLCGGFPAPQIIHPVTARRLALHSSIAWPAAHLACIPQPQLYHLLQPHACPACTPVPFLLHLLNAATPTIHCLPSPHRSQAIGNPAPLGLLAFGMTTGELA